jgi:hypothetical protein
LWRRWRQRFSLDPKRAAAGPLGVVQAILDQWGDLQVLGDVVKQAFDLIQVPVQQIGLDLPVDWIPALGGSRAPAIS